MVEQGAIGPEEGAYAREVGLRRLKGCHSRDANARGVEVAEVVVGGSELEFFVNYGEVVDAVTKANSSSIDDRGKCWVEFVPSAKGVPGRDIFQGEHGAVGKRAAFPGERLGDYVGLQGIQGQASVVKER